MLCHLISISLKFTPSSIFDFLPMCICYLIYPMNDFLITQVEEIDDIDGDSTDPFVAAAVAHEKELALSEEQKQNYKKV